jgi:amino acid adenylation domain-containing protein
MGASFPSEPARPFLLHHLLARAAALDPSREAVRCAGRALSYAELDRAANAVARALIEGGVRPGDRVGLSMPKRVEALPALYGIMRAGAAYVPLDPKAPVARMAMVAEDCAVAALVGEARRVEAILGAMAGHAPRLALTVDDEASTQGETRAVTYEEVIAGAEAADPQVAVIEDDLAYILYTSGSTGVPKGVMLTHRNALAFVEWAAGSIGIRPEDRVSNHAPFHFDLSIFDIYLAALGGATLVLVPDEDAYFGQALADLIRAEAITVWYSVPSALQLITKTLDGPGGLPSLRTVVFAGEVYPTPRLRELRALVPDVPLWNIYGPTETNVITAYRVDGLPPDDTTIPIGRACEGSDVFAIREDGDVAGVGEVGELYARGPTVMKGYWGRPDRTAEVLGPDPRPGALGDPAYRTGDLVRLRPDGDLDFLGRRDHQIKSRGYRIELGEIEAALASHPQLRDAAAVAVPHEQWGKAIHAFVVPGEGRPSERDLRGHMAARIPRYMFPTSIEFVDELPRTPNGKVDRVHLGARAEGRTGHGT